MITVACVWVKGNVDYSVEYVTRLRAMVARHLTLPHEFVCLTDRPWVLPGNMGSMPIRAPHPLAGWWAKIELFRPGRFEGRVLYLDLDTLVVADLAPIVEYPSEFALIPTAGNFHPRDGKQVVRRFNSSVMVWEAGVPDFLYERWRPGVADRLHGDQDYFGEQVPHADTFPLSWFPRISELITSEDFIIPPTAKVVLVKKPKCVEAARRWPKFREAWA